MTASIVIGLTHGGTGGITPAAARTNLEIIGTTGNLAQFGANGILGNFAPPLILTSTNTIGTIQSAATGVGTALNLTSATGRCVWGQNSSSTLSTGRFDNSIGSAISAYGPFTDPGQGTIQSHNDSASTGSAIFADMLTTSNTGSTAKIINSSTSTGKALELLGQGTGPTCTITNQAGTASVSGGPALVVTANYSSTITTSVDPLSPTAVLGGALQSTNNLATSGGDSTAAIVGRVSALNKMAVILFGEIRSHGSNVFSSSLLKTISDGNDSIGEEAASLVKEIPLFKFNRKGVDASKGAHYGIVAEDLHSVFPQAVTMDSYTYIPNIESDAKTKLLKVAGIQKPYLYELAFSDEAEVRLGTIVNGGEVLIHYEDKDTGKTEFAFFVKRSGLKLTVESSVELPDTVSVHGTYEKCPSVNKNMVFELALVALQNALKRIEILESSISKK